MPEPLAESSSMPAVRTRGHPWLAWLVIGLVAAVVVWRSAVAQPARAERLDLLLLEMQARYLLGAATLVKESGPVLYKQAEAALNRGTYAQRLRFVLLAGELAGADTALRRLSELQELQAQGKLQSAPEEKSLTDLVERLYTRRLEQPPLPDNLTEEERSQLESLGWLGRLALTPPGSPDRDRVLAPARRTAVLLPVLGLAGFFLVVVGFVLLVVLAVRLAQGRLRSGLGLPGSHGGIYAETFALWMVLYVGLGYLTSLFQPPGQTLLLSLAAMLGSLVVLVWPVLRGVPWRQVRQDVGLHAGSRPATEVLLGLGCYVTALPLMLVGLLLMGGLLLLKRRLGFVDDPFGPSSAPGHPIVEALVRGDGWLRFQVLVAAGVVAPLVEEIVFRGLLYRQLREASNDLGGVRSVLLSTLVVSGLFAAIHPQGLLAVPGLMALASAFTLVREWRGSLLPGMVSHGINNGVLTLGLLGLAA